MTAVIPPFLREVLRAEGPARRRAARAALAVERPWEAWRDALSRALRSDPVRVEGAASALAGESERARDPALTGRLLRFEAYAAHRAGRVDRAESLYERAAVALSAAGLPADALEAGIARVDALATAGRVRDALALARRLAPRTRGSARRPAAAALAANRANALRLAGDVEGAQAAYAAAERAFATLRDERRVASVRLNLGVAEVEAGDPRRGRVSLERAAADLTRLGFADLALEARANLAWADVHAGRLGDGIRALDALAAEHRLAALGRREGVCRMDLADALRRAGDPAAARREATRAAACFEEAGALGERAEALCVALGTFDVGDAAGRPLVRAARRAAKGSGRESVRLRVELAADPATAATVARRAAALGQRGLEADARLAQGAVALAAGRPSDARRALAAAVRLSPARPWTRLAAEAGLAELDARRPGGVPRAVARLRRIGALHEAIRADLPGAWLRSRFAAERLDPFLVRVDVLLARGRPADLAEAEAVLDALAARRLLAPRTSPRDARADRIRARLEAIYDRIARGEGPSRGGEAATEDLVRRASAWERAFVARRRAVERREGARPTSPRAAGSRADATSIHLWARDGVVLGLVRDATGIRRTGPLGDLATWRRWESALAFQARTYPHLRASAAAASGPARSLLRAISDRVLPALRADTWAPRVFVTSDPSLPDLPFELLGTDAGPVGHRCEVLRTPLGGGGRVRARAGTGAVVLGVGAPDLPGVDAEVRRVGERLRAERILLGADATRAALREALASARVVHVAGHGWDAAEAPPLAGLRMADGWFFADDVPDQVPADLVVLAACRSGRASGPAATAWGGLVARLLSAGARRVVWASDDLDDAAGAAFAGAYHDERTTSPDGPAFGRALLRVADATGHPGSVLPFRLSGVLP